MEPLGDDKRSKEKENGFHGAQDVEVRRVESGRVSLDDDEGSGGTDPSRVQAINQNSATSSGATAKPGPDKPAKEPPSSASSVESPGEGSGDAHLVKAGEPSSRIGASGQSLDDGGSIASEVRKSQQQQQQQLRPGPAASTRSMVPDNEDDEEDGNGRAASPRQHTLQNYASRESGATMLESSAGSKGMANLLDDDKDKYAISPCEDRRWAVLGLSEDILVRTIKISSHERYSSLVKDFQVLASPTYPVKEWLDLGTFTAKSVQGEQTFELAQPVFARYLKFKFLSHHGGEFYCTLTQVKVHGSTMLESFQHEWQQSSAEVREMQDMMKKDSKASVGASSVGINGSSISSGGGGGSNANKGASMPTPGGSPRSRVAPRHAGTTADIDDGVGNRPHAASAATVPPSGKRPGVVSGVVGDGGEGGAAKMENIVPGVHSEMVVPASAVCVGPAGTDGSCRAEVIVDGVAGAEMDVEGKSSTPLGAEVPTIGAEASTTMRPGDDQAVGGVETGGGNGDDDPGHAKTSSVAETKRAGLEPATIQLEEDRDHVTAGSVVTSEGRKQKLGGGSAVDVSGSDTAHGGEGGGESEGETQAGGEEPPRKGIILSTMEAISKAVHRSDGSKARDGVDKTAGNSASRDVGSGPSTMDGLAERIDHNNEERTGTPSSKFASTAAGGAVGDGEDYEEIAVHGNDGRETERTLGVGSTADAPAPRTAARRVEHKVGSTVDVNTGEEGRGISDSAARTVTGKSAPSVTREEPHKGQPLGGCVAGVGESLKRSCGSVDKDVESTSSTIHGGVETASRLETDKIHASDGEASNREAIEQGGSPAEQAGPNTELPLEAADDSRDPREEAAARTQTLSMSPPETLPSDNEAVSSGSALYVTEDAQGGEPLVRVDDMDAAAMAAACLDRLTFSEFREEVLSRTQHAHHSAGGGNGGGGDAISGQYESIFKTLMNKIKTLEINQSLFSLYVDDVHACYQDVIAQIIQEQKRARASQSELLHAQTVHIMHMSDQWPAFHALQKRIVEVEDRMLLSSMAWFSSLLCLAILVCSCCVNICRRLAVVGSDGGGDRDGGGRGRRRRGRGQRRYCHRDWSPACAECDGASAAAAIFANGSDSPVKNMGWCQNNGVRESTGASVGWFRGHAGVATEPGSLPERGSAERVRGAGVVGSTSHGTARCSSCGEVTIGVANDRGDGRLEKRRC